MRKLKKKITLAENTFEPHVTFYHDGKAITKPVSVDSIWKLGEEKANPLIFSNVQSSMLSPDIPVITQEEYDATEFSILDRINFRRMRLHAEDYE